MKQMGEPMVIEKVAFMPVRERKVPFARSKGKDIFFNLGGKREPGETELEALVREVREEAGVELVPESIKFVHKFDGPCHGYPAGTVLSMKVYTGEWRGELTPSTEVEEIVWFTSADAPRTTDMGKTILAWFKAHNLID
jgi:8-oxo-dGTP diphosphatase